jgi:ABC-type maltose transport system permease subunit
MDLVPLIIQSDSSRVVSIMIQDQDKFTLMLGLQGFVQYDYGSAWGAYAAGAIIGALPIIIVYVLLQDQIVGGLTAGSVKG